MKKTAISFPTEGIEKRTTKQSVVVGRKRAAASSKRFPVSYFCQRLPFYFRPRTKERGHNSYALWPALGKKIFFFLCRRISGSIRVPEVGPEVPTQPESLLLPSSLGELRHSKPTREREAVPEIENASSAEIEVLLFYVAKTLPVDIRSPSSVTRLRKRLETLTHSNENKSYANVVIRPHF